MLRSTNGEKDQISSAETNVRYVPKINATIRLNGNVRNSRCNTAGMERNAPAIIAGVVPSNSATRITASKEMSAARKFGTTTRTHTPSVNGTQINAKSASVCPALRRVTLNSRFLKTVDRDKALEIAAAMPSFINSVIRINLESITTSLYSVRSRESVCIMFPLIPRPRRKSNHQRNLDEMASETHIRQATPQDTEVVASILNEAARWLEQAGMPLWQEDELAPANIAADVRAGLFFLLGYSGDAAGTVKFQLDDPMFWPDASRQDAAYIHRLAVRRRYAGTGLS